MKAAATPTASHGDLHIARPVMPTSWRVRRAAAAVLTCALLWPAESAIAWLQSLYPPDAVTWLVAAVSSWLLGALILGAWLMPAWWLAVRFKPDEDFVLRALRATVIAFVVQPVLHGIVLLVAGTGAEAGRYRAVTIATQLVAWVACAWFAPRTGGPSPDRTRVAVVAGSSLAFTMIVTSQLLWADLIADGLEVLTMGRSLASHVVGRFWSGDLPGVDAAMFTIPYPIDWVIATGGFSDVAARLPLLGYVVVLGLGVLAIVEHGTSRRLRPVELALLLSATIAVCLLQSFNASYDAYASDLAAPAGTDLLAMVFVLITIYFIVAGDTAWTIASAALLALTRPTGPIIFGLLMLAAFVVERDLRSPRLRGAVLALVTAVVVSAIHAQFLESGGGSFITRIRYVRLDDWKRIVFLVLPSGIAPVLAMLRWKSMDAVSRSLALVTLAYFAFFYGVAFVALHHFVPAMVLPIAAFWRTEAMRPSPSSGTWRLAIAGGVALALITSLPRNFTPYRDGRRIAAGMAFEAGTYDGDWPAVVQAFEHSLVLDSLFAPSWVADESATRVADASILLHYASSGGASDGQAQYIVRDTAMAPPPGTTRVAASHGVALYVRDMAAWRAEQANVPSARPHNRWYFIPRTTLFRHLGVPAGVHQLDLLQVARRLLGRETG